LLPGLLLSNRQDEQTSGDCALADSLDPAGARTASTTEVHMRISQAMTTRVDCIGPDATVEEAARLMRECDIGAVPVVIDDRPVGIVTDRDIAIRAAAHGRDPSQMSVCEIMTPYVICCSNHDTVESAARVMEKNQVRRLLVLDDDDCLCGILSLGDLAVRTGRDELSEEVLEQVSWPGHARTPARESDVMGGALRGTAIQLVARVSSPRARRMVVGSVGAFAAGAMAMYLLDPQRGRRRRVTIRDKAVRFMHRAQRGLGKTSRYARGQAQGLIAGTRNMFRIDHPDDAVVRERVRSALGRAVSHPGAIVVEARNGVVTLSGLVLAKEVSRLMSRVSRTYGVRQVVNDLDVRPHAGVEPSLQGRGRAPMRERNWSPTTRAAGAALGIGLLLWGLWRRDAVGAAAMIGGTGALGRSISNLPAKRIVGIGAGRRAVDVQKDININAPVETVFDYFVNYENFPHFMSRVCEVRDLGNGRSHWVVKGPAGMHVSWDADLTRFEPNRIIAWRSVPGSIVGNAGVIRFDCNTAGGTRVHIMLSYNPPGGALGHIAAAIFGADPKSELDADLVRLKTMIETGHPAHDAAQPLHRGANRTHSGMGGIQSTTIRRNQFEREIAAV